MILDQVGVWDGLGVEGCCGGGGVSIPLAFVPPPSPPHLKLAQFA